MVQDRHSLRRERANGLPLLLSLVLLTSSLWTPAPALASDDPTMDQCGEPAGGGVYTWTSGRVADKLGRPIAGAFVQAVRKQDDYAYTDSDGDYTVRIWLHCPTSLKASHPSFVSGLSEEINFATPLFGPHFNLPYKITSATVSPQAFNNDPPKTVTLDVSTPMSNLDGVVWVQLSSGQILESTYMSTDSSGLTSWKASWQVPQATADGHYHLKVCAVTTSSTGACDLLSTGTLLSEVVARTYAVDGTPPLISSPTPLPNHNTLNATPTINAIISDATSGLAVSSIAIDLDGVRVVTGASSYTPSTPLTLGLHSVSVTASDFAGNIASRSWEFGVISFAPQVPTVSLHRQTVDVNPEGNLIGAPTTVTFRDVTVELSAFEGEISAAPFSGYGQLLTLASLSSSKVVFTNETSIASDPVSAGLADLTFESYGGILLPTDALNTIAFKKSSIVIPQVTVNVPAGYNTGGSKAHIFMDDRAPGPTEFKGGVLGAPVPVALPVLATTSQTIEVTEQSSQSVAIGAGTAPKIYVWSTLPGTLPAVFWSYAADPNAEAPPTGYDGPAITFSSPGTPECADGSQCLVTGTDLTGASQDFLTASRASFAIGKGEIYFLGHHFLYLQRDIGNGTNNYIDWHQTSGIVNPARGCLDTYSSLASTPSSGWSRGATAITDKATRTSDSDPKFTGSATWDTFATKSSKISNSGYAHSESQFKLDPDTSQTSWSLPKELRPLNWRPQQMISGFEFKNDTYPRTLKLEQEHQVKIVIEGDCT